jgi:hypothetical protein
LFCQIGLCVLPKWFGGVFFMIFLSCQNFAKLTFAKVTVYPKSVLDLLGRQTSKNRIPSSSIERLEELLLQIDSMGLSVGDVQQLALRLLHLMTNELTNEQELVVCLNLLRAAQKVDEIKHPIENRLHESKVVLFNIGRGVDQIISLANLTIFEKLFPPRTKKIYPALGTPRRPVE